MVMAAVAPAGGAGDSFRGAVAGAGCGAAAAGAVAVRVTVETPLDETLTVAFSRTRALLDEGLASGVLVFVLGFV